VTIGVKIQTDPLPKQRELMGLLSYIGTLVQN
jgi:hypothetical protein